MSTQIVMASTLFAAACAAAAVDSGLLGTPERRILLVVNSAPKPELTPALDEIDGAGAVLSRFDQVEHLTDTIEPVHPHSWSLKGVEYPMLERLLRSHWSLGDDRVELVLESIALPPASTLANIFEGAPIRVLSDGLMAYGPTRTPIPWRVARRTSALVHLDLVAGLRPALLSEHQVPGRVIPFDAVRKLFAEIADASGQPPGEDPGTASEALVVGQYLSALGLMSREDEGMMYAQMVKQAADAGAASVTFKPHPSSPPGYVEAMRRTADEHGVAFRVLRDERPVEVHFASRPPRLVLGCFSTALLTAREIFGIPIRAVGTRPVLRRLKPWANSNRVPVVIVDALTRPESPYTETSKMQALVNSVAYAMQPETLAHLSEEARDTFARMPRAEMVRYHRRWRARELDLPWRYAPQREAVSQTARKGVPESSSALLRLRRRLGRARRRLLPPRRPRG